VRYQERENVIKKSRRENGNGFQAMGNQEFTESLEIIIYLLENVWKLTVIILNIFHNKTNKYFY